MAQVEELFVVIANAIGHEMFHERADQDGLVELNEEEAAAVGRIARRVLTDVAAFLGT